MTPRITLLAHEAVRAVVRPGDRVVDATAGNGHDTEFLARLVGPNGHVFAVDISEEAVHETERRIADAGLTNVEVIRADHATMADWIPPGVAAVMFNLGYRPRSERSVATKATTTEAALEVACRLLRPGGVVTVMAYIGHPGGREETETVEDFCRRSPDEFTFSPFAIEYEDSPRFFTLTKRRKELT